MGSGIVSRLSGVIRSSVSAAHAAEVTTATTTRSPSGPAAITIENVAKTYGSKTIFESLDLAVGPSEFVCLLGQSGCGKTTLLHMIAGLESPTGGTITVQGERVNGPDPRRGVVFQDPRLYPWLSVRENVALGPRLRRATLDEDRIDSLLELVGLDGVADAVPGELSGGMAQRAALARTLANDPEILLLDEPFSALDELTKLDLQDELARIREQLSIPIVFVTHDIEEAVYLGDRVAVVGDESTDLRGIVDVERAGRAPTDSNALERRQELFELLRLASSSLTESGGDPG